MPELLFWNSFQACKRYTNHSRDSRFMMRSRITCVIFLCCCVAARAKGQCAGQALTPQEAADCAGKFRAMEGVTPLDPQHSYSLAELIDLAEHNNPRTRIAWERAKQTADRLGIEKSAYFPVLAGVAAVANQRVVEPFPKPLASRGYTVTDLREIQPEITLDYLIFDFGRRAARVDGATAERLAAGANFIRTNQEVAYGVASAYYRLITAQERLQATQETLKTAQTTQDAAEAQLNNGRSTLPDVLNTRAETSQAVFDRESADGDEKLSRVLLTEVVGVEPSPNVRVEAPKDSLLPQTLTLSIDALIERAMSNRPDLLAQIAEIRAADDAVRAARAEYKPKVGLSADVAQTFLWPSAFPPGVLGYANQTTWSMAVALEWRIFDGGARAKGVEAAESRRREAKDELTDKRDQATREVWSSYILFRTAVQKEQAAVALLEAANASYSASLEAYQYGVKNLIDVVTAGRQLAQARLSSVAARSQLFLEAVNLEFVTGNLLRNQPPAAVHP
jgi:outer membrane protein